MSDPKNITTPFDADDAVLLARASMYRFISRLLSDPVEASEACKEDFDLAQAAMEFLNFPEFQKEIDRIRVLRPKTNLEARELYSSLFGFMVSPEIPPFEVEYLERSDLFYRSTFMADIAGFYKAFHIELQRRERPDHISVEAEFLWYLLERIVACRKFEHGAEKEALLAETFQCFFNEHFNSWVDSFACRLKATAKDKMLPFYDHASDLLSLWLTKERIYLDVPATPLKEPMLSAQISAPPECDACPEFIK